MTATTVSGDTTDGPDGVSPRPDGLDSDGIERRMSALVDRVRHTDLLTTLGVPIVSVLIALVVGGVLILVEGENPLAVYGEMLRAAFLAKNGPQDVFVAATPLIFLGVGLSVAYRARAFTIGAEGQYVIGATAALAWVTAGGVRDLPGWLLIASGLLIAALVGAAWSALCALLNVRFGTSVVITSLLLNYVAIYFMYWVVREPIRDPDGFISQSRLVGNAQLPRVPGLDVHLGFVLALAVVPIIAVLVARSRFGFRIDVMGNNRHALSANETSPGKYLALVLAMSGALAGIAGFVQIAGVNGRVSQTTPAGYGFTAIIVALLGRLNAVGALLAALALSVMTIGLGQAQRTYDLPSNMLGVIQALVVLMVVVGDALATRWTKNT